MSHRSSSRGRILVINWQDLANPLSGGAEVHLQENLKRLSASGFDITLLCSNFDGGKSTLTWEGVRILRRGGRFDFNWQVPFLVRRLLKEEKFDLVIEDINKIPFYSPLFQPLPVLALVPHLFATTVFHEINALLASYIYICEYPVRWVYRKIPFCVISESTRTDLIERGIDPGHVRVIHCGIDTDTYSFDPEVLKSKDPLIIYLGRLKKYKSVQHLIKAFARLRARVDRATLVILGDGDYRRALEDLVKALRLEDAVSFAGFVSTDLKVEFLRKAWVAVCPSLKEGWGLTNIEANACGTPVIAADVPGLRDSVQHGSTGRLYPYGDLVQLEDDMHAIVSDSVLRGTLAENGRAWAAKFSWDDAAEELGQMIESRIKWGQER